MREGDVEICQYWANDYPQMCSCRPEEDSPETGGWIFYIRKKKSCVKITDISIM